MTLMWVLACRSKWLASLADPWVRLVDPFIGEAVGMRVDVDLEDGTTAAGIFVHKLLSDSVGYVCCINIMHRCKSAHKFRAKALLGFLAFFLCEPCLSPAQSDIPSRPGKSG